MAKKVRCVLYARCSTAEQSTEMQVVELREYIAKRGWTLVGEFVDEGYSGTRDSRPQLNAMMAAIRKGKVDAVCVWRFDRFARSTKSLVLALDEFRALGVDFVSLTEGIDCGSVIGKAMFTIISALAEMERCAIVDRVKAGLARARAAGKKLGRPKAQVDVARARALRESGMSLRAVAKELGVATSVLFRALATDSSGA